MNAPEGRSHHWPRLFILGAGFSQPAGLPLTTSLLDACLARAAKVIGAPNQLEGSLDRYRTYAEATGDGPVDPVDVERFVEYLDHAHTLQLLGSDTWSDDGNRDQLMMRWAIGAVIHDATPASDDLPEVYLEFARRLRPKDCVITFNYDLILESALDRIGTPYRRFPARFSDVGPEISSVDSGRDDGEVLILKLHGSVDWVDRTGFDADLAHSELLRDEHGFDTTMYRDRNQVFGAHPITGLHALVDGPRPDADPLLSVMVVEDLDAYYSSGQTWNAASPLILAPSQAKLLYGQALRVFWRGLPGLAWGWASFGIIGYSLPPADRYVRQTIYELARGYGVALANQDGYPGGPRPPITVVDRRTGDGAAELRRRYRFLPDGTNFVLGGFGVDTLRALFDEPGRT